MKIWLILNKSSTCCWLSHIIQVVNPKAWNLVRRGKIVYRTNWGRVPSKKSISVPLGAPFWEAQLFGFTTIVGKIGKISSGMYFSYNLDKKIKVSLICFVRRTSECQGPWDPYKFWKIFKVLRKIWNLVWRGRNASPITYKEIFITKKINWCPRGSFLEKMCFF